MDAVPDLEGGAVKRQSHFAIFSPWRAGDGGPHRLEMRFSHLSHWLVEDRRILWLHRVHPKARGNRKRFLQTESSGK